MGRLSEFLRRKPKEDKSVGGLVIYFLHSQPMSYSDEQLSGAMQRAWRREHDETNFYGVSTFDGEGGLLKMDAMFFAMQHFSTAG